MVDAVAREWFVRLQWDGSKDHDAKYLTKLMRSFFTIFYVDNAYFVSCDPMFLQTALDIVDKLFKSIGLETTRLKMQAMVCTPGRIQTQLPAASYHHMRLGFHTSDNWEACRITRLQECSLPRHMVTLHGVFQQTVVAEELLEQCASIAYRKNGTPVVNLRALLVVA